MSCGQLSARVDKTVELLFGLLPKQSVSAHGESSHAIRAKMENGGRNRHAWIGGDYQLSVQMRMVANIGRPEFNPCRLRQPERHTFSMAGSCRFENVNVGCKGGGLCPAQM